MNTNTITTTEKVITTGRKLRGKIAENLVNPIIKKNNIPWQRLFYIDRRLILFQRLYCLFDLFDLVIARNIHFFFEKCVLVAFGEI